MPQEVLHDARQAIMADYTSSVLECVGEDGGRRHGVLTRHQLPSMAPQGVNITQHAHSGLTCRLTAQRTAIDSDMHVPLPTTG